MKTIDTYTQEEYEQMIEMMAECFPNAEICSYSYMDYATSSPMRDGMEIREFLDNI